MRARADRPMRMGLRIHVIARPMEREAREAARELLSRAAVSADRAEEYARFDSVGQARMNAIAADDEGWVAPGAVGGDPRGPRRGRHGARGLVPARSPACSARTATPGWTW